MNLTQKKAICRVALIFVIAFALNALWEFWHAQFYAHYHGGAITVFILLRAALVDALIITITIVIAIVAQSRLFIFSYSRELAHEQLEYPYSTRALWFAVPAWFIVAVLLEWWALSTHRWAYNDIMPIIPFVQIGLTPTIQLALLGTTSWYIVRALWSRK